MYHRHLLLEPTIQFITMNQQRSGDTLSWVNELLSKPSFSTRHGLAWGYADQTEASDVLVLTSRNSTYVDVRFALTGKPTSPTDPHFWAFAGTCETTVGGIEDSNLTSGFECTAHGKWAHPIDSMKLFDAVDEGDMFLLANGDVMEVGMMRNPKSGLVELYKEYWAVPAPKPRSVTPSVVVTTEDRGKGIIVRVGNYCQGIYQSSDGELFWLERWAREGGTGDGKWIRDHRSTTRTGEVESDLPTLWTVDDSRKTGDEVKANGRTWKVTEVYDP